MKISPFIILFLISSCSTLNKARVYGALGGATAGAGIGLGVGELVDNKNGYTKSSNMMAGLGLGVLGGGILGAFLADFFWNEDPENREMKQMILEEKKVKNGIPLIEDQNFGMDQITRSREEGLKKAFEDIDLKTKVYNVDAEVIPEDLKDEIQKQKIIIYDVPEQTIHLKDGRTIIIKGTKAKEHIYEEPKR